ncbi:MAG TPA: hypothetical protein VFW86_05955 [Candidatus Limnocylindrales bacterium]|nr:hypothetical protein [Candidatus Limnocylindrales bacterium]
MDDAKGTTSLQLTPNELRLVRTALEMLEDTLGHEEADELEEVQALLARLPDAPPRGDR